MIREELMRSTDWFAVQQIKSLQRATRRKLKEQRQDEPVSVRCSLSVRELDGAADSVRAVQEPPALDRVGLRVGVSLKLEDGALYRLARRVGRQPQAEH